MINISSSLAEGNLSRKETTLEKVFDISFLLYFIIYLIFYDGEGLFGKLRLLATAFIMICGGLMLITSSTKGNIQIKNGSYLLWYCCFAMFSLSSILWAYDDKKIVVTNMIRIIILCIFISVRIKSENDIIKLCVLFVISVVCRCVYVLQLMLNYYGTDLLFTRRFGDQFKYNSNENAFLCSLSIVILLFSIKKCHRIKKIICYILLIFLTFILLLTGSKKGFISVILVMSIYGQLNEKGQKKIARLLLSIICVIVLYEILISVPFFYNIIGYRIDNMLSTVFLHNISDSSTGNRIKLIKEGIDIWLQHPILGVGLNNFSLLQDIGGDNYYSHCNYVELLADLGIVGFSIYYGFLFRLVSQKVQTSLEKFIKSIVITILILDVGTISYQQFYLHFFYMLLSLVVFRNNKNEEL